MKNLLTSLSDKAIGLLAKAIGYDHDEFMNDVICQSALPQKENRVDSETKSSPKITKRNFSLIEGGKNQ